ncbi:tetratricopeptide repeat protein [Flagellimonas allohymeniacidonis]|uniref:Uncharacterized protein n=1 Tax=Flagellimonas allohymeniacidonis TaxID=2517819 RepID=A0A4Q8QJV3_9FLAO|nr:hypothetical protein [Allomuricauda hymeniacidonis]TAI48516.1 hypothetical protein EW142_01545 [Allomuricauda hymeniacidonis]
MRFLFILALILVTHSCDSEKQFATNVKDYEKYLNMEASKTTSKYFELWNSKITSDSTQLLSFGNVASEYNRFFQNTGNIKYLKKAEKALKKAVEIAAVNKSGYLRALSRNYISQHRFQEALESALSARSLGSGVKESQQLLFDVHMELGNYRTAYHYLDSIKDMANFGYLIRAAKYKDHKGNLDGAIAFMEKAKQKAESSKNKKLMVWTYTNLADFYGHAGRLDESYGHYLKTLALNPSNAYAKKGIAWIIFSHERNGKEALRILDSVEGYHASPDHYLLKAEIAEFIGDETERMDNLKKYGNLVGNASYGLMYNLPNIQLYLEESEKLNMAIQIAKDEVANRATPETYSMLALAYLKNGYDQKALTIANSEVYGKSFEPEVLLRLLKIYRANGQYDRATNLKKELEEAIFELGPLSQQVIASL